MGCKHPGGGNESSVLSLQSSEGYVVGDTRRQTDCVGSPGDKPANALGEVRGSRLGELSKLPPIDYASW